MAKNNTRPKGTLIQHVYGILLKDKGQGKKYMVIFNNETHIVEDTHVNITCDRPISTQELFYMFAGTDDIIGIIGDFTDDKLTDKDNKK